MESVVVFNQQRGRKLRLGKFGRAKFVFLVALVSLNLLLIPFSIFEIHAQKSVDDITFQPNAIPSLNITARPLDKPESFRFEWKGNKLDIELFFNATLQKTQKGVATNTTKLWSLRDFEVDFNLAVSYNINKNKNNATFGWFISNPDNLNEWVHNAWFKIEDTQPFGFDDIRLEEIDSFADLGYNITRLNLPYNLILSFEDLRHKGFVVGWQNKTHTEVKGFGDESNWDLDPIVYSSGVITITGYSTEATGARHDTIFTQIANSSIFNRLGINLYWSDARIVVGDGSNTTWLVDYGVAVEFSANAITVSYQALYTVKANSRLRFGILIDATDKTTRNGVFIRSMEATQYINGFVVEANGQCYIYSSTFIAHTTIARNTLRSGKLYNSLFSAQGVSTVVSIALLSMDVFKGTITSSFEGWTPSNANNVMNTLETTNGYQGVRLLTINGMTIKNIRIRDCSYSFFLDSRYTYYIVNPDVDSWTISWYLTQTGKTYRQYEFDLTVTYPNGTTISGANVTIAYEGQGGGIVGSWLTNSSGQIPEQTLTRGFYNVTGGNTLYDYSPYNLTITSSYGNYTQLWTPAQKEFRQIALTSAPSAPSESTFSGTWLMFGAGAGLIIGSLFAVMLVKTRKTEREEMRVVTNKFAVVLERTT